MGYDNLFAIRDIANIDSKKWTQGQPMLAQPTLQQGKLLGEKNYKIIQNQKPKSFENNNLRLMAIIR